MKELADEPSLRDTGTIVEVDHPERGPYLSVGCPVKLVCDNDVVVERSPLLGEHSAEILGDVLGYDAWTKSPRCRNRAWYETGKRHCERSEAIFTRLLHLCRIRNDD